MANITYNRMIRKLTVAFGDLFNNITLVRYNLNESEQERFLVPLDYATKELYVMRLQGDPDLDKKVQMTLPRMSYEMNGLSYDSSRKQITNIENLKYSALIDIVHLLQNPVIVLNRPTVRVICFAKVLVLLRSKSLLFNRSFRSNRWLVLHPLLKQIHYFLVCLLKFRFQFQILTF